MQNAWLCNLCWCNGWSAEIITLYFLCKVNLFVWKFNLILIFVLFSIYIAFFSFILMPRSLNNVVKS
jgi:hypothetical protein